MGYTVVIGFLEFIMATLSNPAEFSNVGDFPIKSITKGGHEVCKNRGVGKNSHFSRDDVLFLGKTQI